MKIYPNPNFPRKRPTFAASRALPPRRERIDTLTFVSELEARNARALEQGALSAPRALIDKPVANGTWRTGPPIKTPDGHIHVVEPKGRKSE